MTRLLHLRPAQSLKTCIFSPELVALESPHASRANLSTICIGIWVLASSLTRYLISTWITIRGPTIISYFQRQTQYWIRSDFNPLGVLSSMYQILHSVNHQRMVFISTHLDQPPYPSVPLIWVRRTKTMPSSSFHNWSHADLSPPREECCYRSGSPWLPTYMHRLIFNYYYRHEYAES